MCSEISKRPASPWPNTNVANSCVPLDRVRQPGHLVPQVDSPRAELRSKYSYTRPRSFPTENVQTTDLTLQGNLLISHLLNANRIRQVLDLSGTDIWMETS